MPVHESSDSKGNYFQWGTHGKKYYYDPKEKGSAEEARKFAVKQGQAIRASGWKESKGNMGTIELAQEIYDYYSDLISLSRQVEWRTSNDSLQDIIFYLDPELYEKVVKYYPTDDIDLYEKVPFLRGNHPVIYAVLSFVETYPNDFTLYLETASGDKYKLSYHHKMSFIQIMGAINYFYNQVTNEERIISGLDKHNDGYTLEAYNII